MTIPPKDHGFGGDPDQAASPDASESPDHQATTYEAASGHDERDGADRHGAGGEPDRGRHGWTRWRQALVIVLVSGLVLGGCAFGVLWYLTDRYLGNIDRVGDVFSGIDESQRPAPAVPEDPTAGVPLTFLLVGSDSRDPAGEGPPSARSDVIMLMRLTADRTRAQLISIPRDTWVFIPGEGMNKINAAYAFGGPTLLIETVERLTSVRIDHYAAIDFSGFQEITDALGGVTVNVAETTTTRGETFTAGPNTLDGRQALIYVRQRYGLPGGDLDRVQRQQNYLRSMIGEILDQNLLGDLGRTDELLLALTSSISVDDTLANSDLLGLAYSLRGLTPAGLTFLTVPVAGLGREGAQSVVYIDAVGAAPLWQYLNADSLAEHLPEFESDALPAAPN